MSQVRTADIVNCFVLCLEKSLQKNAINSTVGQNRKTIQELNGLKKIKVLQGILNFKI